MNDETKILLELAELREKYEYLKKCAEEDKEHKKQIQDMLMSIQELSYNVKSVVGEMEEQKNILSKLQNEPNELMLEGKKKIVDVVVDKAITAIIFLIAFSMLYNK